MKFVLTSLAAAAICSATVLSAQAARGTATDVPPAVPRISNPEPGTPATPGTSLKSGTQNPEPGSAATTLARVQDLYASAAYEDALAAIPAPGAEVSRDLEQYRALCLLALGRANEAAASVERVVSGDPLFVPPASDTPPRLQTMYADTRLRMAPGLAKASYAEAKNAWEKKDRAAAHAAFQRTLDVIALVADPVAAGLGDLRDLASGFLMLTAAAPAAAGPAPAAPAAGSGAAPSAAAGNGAAPHATASNGAPPAPAGNTAASTVGVGLLDGDWQGPVALRQDMPGWQPPDAAARRIEYRGRIRLTIDPAGRVESVKVVKPSHPAYDAAVTRAARLWAFTPATRAGVPVSSEKEIDVHLRPQ